MAQHLHTQAISAGIVDLVKEARERLVIDSPYLKLSNTLLQSEQTAVRVACAGDPDLLPCRTSESAYFMCSNASRMTPAMA